MVGAALLARNAVEKGLTRKPWVKTSLAPGSQVVTGLLRRAGLTPYLDKLGFNLVGYGCTTCIGNSGPLPEEISDGHQGQRPRGHLGAVRQPQLRGPDQPRRQDELPGLAAAGRRLRPRGHHGRRPRTTTPLGMGPDGKPVFLSDIWPSPEEVAAVVASSIGQEMFSTTTPTSSTVTSSWQSLPIPTGNTFEWDPSRPTSASPRTSRA